MSLPVLTAVTGAPWESRLVAALEHEATGLVVARRCVDLPDLLAAAAAGHGRAVLLSPDLRRLDRDALARLAAVGVAVVGVVSASEPEAEGRLRQLGVTRVVAAEAAAGEVAAAVLAAVEALSTPDVPSAPGSPSGSGAGSRAGSAPRAQGVPPPRRDAALADPAGALPLLGPEAALDEADPDPEPGAGSEPGALVAVWGPTGAPGRTSVATVLAGELAAAGRQTLLADADTYGGAVAQVLGLLDEAPGLAGAARAANAGRLDVPDLARHARLVSARLRVLTGIVRADRWAELRPGSLEVVWALARGLADVTVVDCGFCIEQDEELSFDTTAPRRNAATLVTLEQADTVVAVGSADPVGLQRLVRGLDALRETVPVADLVVVVNRVRAAVVGRDPEAQVRAALARYAGVRDPVLVPDDRAGFDTALCRGRMLAEVVPGSPALPPLRALARRLGGLPARGRSSRPGAVSV